MGFNENKELTNLELVEKYKSFLVDVATSGPIDDEYYRKLRTIILNRTELSDKIPTWSIENRNVHEYWEYIKSKFSTYKERRNFIKNEFKAILLELERMSINVAPIEFVFREDYINRDWKKALNRMKEDPEAAITSSRSLLESVLKHILDEQGIEYSKNEDLSVTYKKVSKLLNFAPEQHQEQVFKQILSGANGIVNGLGTLRNKLSDAHGKSKYQVRPKERHSELAVHLAGAMSIFIYKSYIEKYE